MSKQELPVFTVGLVGPSHPAHSVLAAYLGIQLNRLIGGVHATPDEAKLAELTAVLGGYLTSGVTIAFVEHIHHDKLPFVIPMPPVVNETSKEPMTLQALGLQGRTYDCLVAYGYDTIEKVTARSFHELMKVPGIGRSSVNVLEARLNEYGFHLMGR